MDRNNVRPIPVSINTKFLNFLQPEWRKYVIMVRHNQTGDTVSYDVLYDSLVQFEPHVLASKAKKAAKNYYPLALLPHSNSFSSQSHTNSSYSPYSYYVTHPSSFVNYEDEYQKELQGDSQEDKLTTAKINQAVVQDGRFDIQTKNAGYGGNGNKNAGRQNRNQAFNAGNGDGESNQIVQRVPLTESIPGKVNVQCYNYNGKGHYARDCQKPRVGDAKYFREQILLAMKDEAGSNLKDKENDFMFDNSYGEETMEELAAAVMLMARLQPTDNSVETVPSYDAKALRNLKEKDKIESDFLKIKNEKLIIQHETQLAKKAFKEREDRYLDDIVGLEEKLSSHDQMVYKIGVESSNSVRRPKSKDTKSRNRALNNTNDNSSSAYVRKMSSSVSIDSNNVKRALLTTPVAAKSKNLGATFVVAKSRLSVAKTPTATNKVIYLVLWIVDSGCSKHMTGNLQLLRNFVEKFMGTVRFGNDDFAGISRYGDYVQDNIMICHVYYVEGLGHNLFSVGQFCNGDLEVAFRLNTCYVWNLEGDDLITGLRDSNLYTISISKMAASSPVFLMSRATSTKSWFWHHMLSHLNFGIVHKTSIAGTPQQNGVVERRNCTLVDAARTMLIFSKTLEFLWAEAIATACFTQNRFIVHTRSLCYPTNNRDDLGNMKSKADIGIFIGYSESSRGFQYYATSSPEVSNSFAANTLDKENTSSSSSIVVEEDESPQILVQEDDAEFDRNVFYNPPQTLVFKEAESSSTFQDPSNMHENRLQNDAEVCMYALTVSTIESKNIKEAMVDHSWIESMQDELN
ncbi:retrovirus-related pol polyprotein from transposon TNT 1-94 [Tanacetum coccineum]